MVVTKIDSKNRIVRSAHGKWDGNTALKCKNVMSIAQQSRYNSTQGPRLHKSGSKPAELETLSPKTIWKAVKQMSQQVWDSQ